MIGRNRVVITGLGVLAANGIGKEAFWDSLMAGESGIGPVTQFDTAEIPWKLAGEVNDFEPHDYITPSLKPKRQSRNTQFAAAATTMALEDSGLSLAQLENVLPVPVTLGISLGGLDLLEQHTRRIIDKGMIKALPSAAGCVHVIAPSFISAMLGCSTKINVISNSCTGGLDAIAHGADLIRRGESEVVIAGGTDAVIVPSVISGLGSAGMLSTSAEQPENASRPFDLKRSGGIVAEGAGVLIMESLQHANARDAKMYAEILGHGTASSIRGTVTEGLTRSMQQSINNSACNKNDIGYINAHAPSDQLLDIAETEAIKTVFGTHAYSIPITSIKGATGNPLAAGGAIQAISCCLSHEKGIIPPTTNYKISDPNCDLDYVPGTPRNVHLSYTLINSHGTGGVNSSLILKYI